MNIGPSDIVRGIQIALLIYDVCFTHDNRADVRYAIFNGEVDGLREEIQSFKRLLEQLQTSLFDSRRRYDGRKFSDRALDPLAQDFEIERCKIIGNFNATLEECRRVLEEKKNLSGKKSNALVNGAWYIQTQPKIEELRKRLQMHTTKVLLVLDRLSFKLLTELDDKVDHVVVVTEETLATSKETLRLVHQLLHGDTANAHELANTAVPEDNHYATDRIARRFEQELMSSDLMQDLTPVDVPLVEGFDSLLFHFDELLNDLDKSKENHLTLLKTRWLIDVIRASRQFVQTRSGFYYSRAINQVEYAVSSWVRKCKLVGYDEDSLIGLPRTSFAIWPVVQEQFSSSQDPMKARATEEEVLRLKLGSTGAQNQATVAMFRQSDTKFRIMLEEPSVEYGRVISTLTMHTDRDKLIPRYALPTVMTACFELAIFSRHEEEEKLYRFSSEEDLFAFQQAVVGYQVSHDQPNIKCQFSKDCNIDCDGRVQLWQDPIDIPTELESSAPGSPLASSPSSNSVGEFRSRHSSFAASVAPSTLHYLDDGLEAGAIKLPALMIYTSLQHRGSTRFAMIFFELDSSIKIIPERCRCATAYDSCPYLALERSSGKKIQVRMSMSQSGDGTSPDPNSFDLMPFRLPRSAQYRGLRVKETSYVLLRFKSLEAKRKFHHELNLRFQVREKQRKDQESIIRSLTTRENRPQRSINQPAFQGGPVRRASYLDDELPPQLEKLELDTKFEMQDFDVGAFSATDQRARTGSGVSTCLSASPSVSRAETGRESINPEIKFRKNSVRSGSDAAALRQSRADPEKRLSVMSSDDKAKGGGIGTFLRRKTKS